MRNFLFALFCFIGVANSYGQTGTKKYGRVDVEITKEQKKKIYIKVYVKPSLPPEDSSLVHYLEKNLQSIKIDRRVEKGKYVVSVQFIVDKEGYVSDVKCLSDPIGFGVEEDVMRIVKKHTIWLPAPYGGTPVKPYRTSSSTSQESN